MTISGSNLLVTASNLDVNTVAGTGGNLVLTAEGELSIQGNVAAISQNGDGGSIALSSGGSMFLPGLVNASANQNGSGGAISITTGGTTVNSNGAIQLRADGAGTGNGGGIAVTFRTSGSTADALLLARSGINGGNGGSITLSSLNGDLSADPHDWNIGLRGDSGNGGSLNLSSRDGKILLAQGTVSVNGKGSGNAGSIAMSALGKGSALNVSTGVLLRANGASGGSVTLTSDGDLSVGSDGIRANANQQSGNGGTISVTAGKVNLAGVFQANGRGIGDGGNIVVTSKGMQDDGGGGVIIGLAAFSNSPEEQFETSSAGEPETIEISQSFQANAGGVGYGGQISIQSLKGSIELGGGSTLPSFLTYGGTQEGDGGSIEINSASDLSITASQLNASARGSGNGGSVELLSGGDTSIRGNLTATGRGRGNGGSIQVFGSGKLDMRGSSTADAGAEGHGGSIELASAGLTNIGKLEAGSSNLLARGGSTNGNGGSLEVSGDAGIIIGLTSISARSRGSSGNAGTIKFSTDGNAEVSSAIDASARATEGNGGRIDFLINGDTLTVNGSIDFSAQTGNAGALVIDPEEATVINGDIIGNVSIVGDGGSFEPPAQSGSFTFGKADLRGGRLAGNGGKLKLITDSFIQINGKIDTSATVGNSGSVHLEAGGRVQTSTIDLSAPAGQVGAILIVENGDTPFTIGGTSASNGVNGSIIMNGLLSDSAQNNGDEEVVAGTTFLAVIDKGSAGITLHDSKVQSRIVLGTGVLMVLDSERGKITLPNGLVNDAVGSNTAGSIWLNSDSLDVQGNGLIRAGGTANGTGGQIFISSRAITFGNTLSVSANGGLGGIVNVTGQGGIQVSLDTVIEGGVVVDMVRASYLPGSDLTISGSGNALFASNGFTNTAGEVSLDTAGVLSLSGQNFTVAARGVSGNAKGNSADVFASFELNLEGTSHLRVLADGSGLGKGGEVSVLAGNDLRIGTGAGQVSADASGGSPGSISISTSAANLSADGDGIILRPGDGDFDGGTLALRAVAGKVDLTDHFMIAGKGSGKGGTLRVHADEVSFQIGSRVTVDGGGTGAGGLIDIIADAGGIKLSTAELNARGGVDGGSGGVVLLTGSGEIKQDATGIVNASSRAAGSANAAGSILVKIDEETPGPLLATINGQFSARNGSGGFGSITFLAITDGGASDVRLAGIAEIDGNLTVNGHSIEVQELRAPEVTLNAHGGSIGGANDTNAKVATERLTFQAVDGVAQNVSVRLFEGRRTGLSAGFFEEVQILSSKATGDVSITVDHLEAVSVSIGQIESGGTVLIDSSNNHLPSSKPITLFSALGVPATISARSNITLQGSTIEFLNGAVVRSTEGSIRVFAAGANDQSPYNFQESQTTANLTLEIQQPYYIAFGLNGVRALGTNNTISASGGIVLLNTDMAPAAAITLGGNVEITAGGNTSETSLSPIAFSESFANAPSSGLGLVREEKYLLSHLPDFQGDLHSSSMSVKRGACLLATRKSMQLHLGQLSTELAPGAQVLAMEATSHSQLINLGYTRVVIELSDEKILVLEPGQEVLVGQSRSSMKDGIARRSTVVTHFHGGVAVVSEVSLPSLFRMSEVLRSLKRSTTPDQQRLLRNIIKTGAALFTVTANHGPYRNE